MPGESQTISKAVYSTEDIEKLSVTFHQYYFVEYFQIWFEFLKITMDMCRQRPGLCPIKAGVFTTTEVHDAVGPFTPHGLYRSMQTFHDPNGRLLGCVRIDLPYVR